MNVIIIVATAILIATGVGGGVAPTPKVTQTLARSEGGIVSSLEAPPTHYNLSEPTFNGDGSVATEGWTDMDTLRHDYIADFALEQEAARVQAEAERKVAVKLDALTGYMRQAGFLPELVNMAPLMLELGEAHGVDPRLCVVTITAEASGGRGSSNLFGSLAGACGGYEAQVRWYFRRVQEIDVQYGYGGDAWHLAWHWHGGGSQGAEHSFYAGNIAASVQTIGGFGGGGSDAG